jgi:YD repeat-containing protein
MRSLLVCLFLSLASLTVNTASAQVYQYDAVGRLLAANYTDGSSIRYEYDANSNITRIRFAPAPVALPPDGVIDAPADDVTIEAGGSVTFEGSGTDPDGALPLAFNWDFDDGATDSTDEDPGAVIFATVGTFTVELTVTDATGLSDPTPDTVTVTVTNPTPPPPPPPPPPPAPSGGGGGAVLWLPLVLGLCLLTRARRSLLLAALLFAGTASAQSWTQMNSGTAQDLNDVWMPSQTLAYAVGDAGTVVRYDGNVWTLVDVGVSEQLNGVWGTGPDDVWIVGNSGTVLHFDGVNWTPVDIGAGTLPLNDVWTSGPGDVVYVVGGRGVWRLEAGSWTRVSVRVSNTSTTTDPAFNFTSIRATNNYVVMTANNSFGLNGGLFVNFVWVSLSTRLDSVWVYNDTLMLAVGDSTRLMDGGDPTSRSSLDWQPYNVGITASDTWGSDPFNIWAVGGATNFGRITYYDGNIDDTWVDELTINRRFFGIDGVDRENVIAVGALGTIYGKFAPPPVATTANISFAGFSEGNVNTYNGELVYETTDIALNTRMPMEFKRYYASNLRDQQTVGGQLSENWTHNYEWRLDTGFGDSGDQVRVTDYRGREYVFDVSGASPVLVSPTSANVGLSFFNNSWEFFDRGTGMRYRLGAQGDRLTSIEDRNGNRHTLLYNQGYLVGVSDGASGLISFSYTPTGKLERVFVDKSTRLETVFTYENGILVSATSPSNVVSRYAYQDGRRLTSIEQGSGTVDAVVEKSWEYDTEGRVAATVLTNAGRFEYVYGGDRTTIVQPNASQHTHAYDANGNLLSSTTPLGAITSYTYDAQGRRTSITDPLDRTTVWTYDAQSGLVASITQPGGFLTRLTYSADTVADGADFYDLDVTTLPNDATIEYGFDGRGNLELLIDEAGNVSLFDYDAAGDLVRAENPAGGVTTYSYFIDGLPRSIIDPNGNERLLSYDAFLRLEIDSFGNRSSNYSYSNRFVPDQIQDRSGAILDFTFNQAGYVNRIDRSDGYFEEYGYDSAGRRVSVNVADVTFWTFGYDSFGRLATVTDPSLRESRYVFDSDGHLQEFRDFDDRRWLFNFASDGQLAYIVKPGGERIDFEYNDPRGHLSAVVNDIERFGFSYDALGLLATATDPEERASSYERNLRGDVQRIVDSPSGAQHLFTSDVFGNVSSYTDPLGGLRQLDFGNDNLLDSAMDPLGNATRFARDSENRVESVDYADGLNVNVQFSGSGLPGRIQGSDGTDITIDSTPEGKIVGGTDLTITRTLTGKPGNSNGIGIEYNSDDRVSRVTFANGRFVDYEYNGRGDVVLVRDWLGAETSITSTDVGKIDLLSFPNGTTTDYDYDRAARITSIQMGSLGSITVNRDVLGRIESIDRTIQTATGMPNEDRNFAYNLASQIEGGTYDARGNQLQQGANSRTWDALNRLTSTGNGADQVLVGYDALGGVTRIAASNGERLYVQNYALGKPRISIERDGAGNDLWYYVHTFDGRLLYRISPTGTRHFYHFDENGNTALLTSDAGAVIQCYLIAPHGETLGKCSDIENPKVASAEQGGMNLGESGTAKLDRAFVDLKSGHELNRKFELQAEYKPGPSFDSQYGRSLTPGNLPKDSEPEELPGFDEIMSAPQRMPLRRPGGAIATEPAIWLNTDDADSNRSQSSDTSHYRRRLEALRALGLGEGPPRARRFPRGFVMPTESTNTEEVVESVLKEVGSFNRPY